MPYMTMMQAFFDDAFKFLNARIQKLPVVNSMRTYVSRQYIRRDKI